MRWHRRLQQQVVALLLDDRPVLLSPRERLREHDTSRELYEELLIAHVEGNPRIQSVGDRRISGCAIVSVGRYDECIGHRLGPVRALEREHTFQERRVPGGDVGTRARRLCQRVSDGQIGPRQRLILQTDSGHQRALTIVPIASVEQDCGNVDHSFAQHGHGRGRKGGPRMSQQGVGQPPDHALSTLGDHPARRFRAHHEGASDGSVHFQHWRISVRPEDVFYPVIPEDRNQLILMPAGFPAAHDVVDLGPDDRPGFLPAVSAALPHRSRVFAAAEARCEGIIVYLNELGSPEQEHGVPGIQHHAYDCLEDEGPARRRAQGSARPVERPDQASGFTVGPEEAIICLHGSVCVHRRTPSLPGRGEKLTPMKSCEQQAALLGLSGR